MNCWVGHRCGRVFEEFDRVTGVGIWASFLVGACW